MNKTKVEIYIGLLKEVFQDPEDAENFIKKRIEEIYE